jgi:RND family efflux transporter MFP subunit
LSKRTWIVAGVAIVVLAVAAILWIVFHRGAAPVAASASPQVATAIARDGSIDVTVDAVGRVGSSAGSDSKLAFAVAGRIASVYVHVGERVVAGQSLAALDGTTYALAARQANADAIAAGAQAAAAGVDRWSAKIAFDQAALQRAQRLFVAGVSARKEVDAARSQLASDQAEGRAAGAGNAAAAAQAQSAAAHAALAAQDASNAVLRAPSDGIVTAVLHNPGESVDPTVPAIALAPAATGAITLEVSAADATRVKPGDPVRLRTDTGDAIAGTVTGVAGAVDAASQSAQVGVRADVPATLAGSALSGQIVIGRSRGTLVPYAAIVADPQTGKTLVFVATKGSTGEITFEPREVRVVFSNAAEAQIAGVRPGERVAARGAFELLAPQGGGV